MLHPGCNSSIKISEKISKWVFRSCLAAWYDLGMVSYAELRDESFITSWEGRLYSGGGGSEFIFVMYLVGGGVKRK